MADIELVIKIPEEDFERCKKKFQMRIDIMGDAIANGIPLSKGRGDLIDRKELLKQSYRIDDSATLSTRDVVNVEEIVNTPTIIQADKESGC